MIVRLLPSTSSQSISVVLLRRERRGWGLQKAKDVVDALVAGDEVELSIPDAVTHAIAQYGLKTVRDNTRLPPEPQRGPGR